MSEIDLTLNDKIYRQKEEGTWCNDRIESDDVPYYRKSKATERIKAMESDMQEFVEYASEHSLIGQTKKWKDKFKQTLNKK